MKPGSKRNPADAIHAHGTGLQTDTENLLKKFEKTDSVRYEDFQKVWQEMRFSLIFCGQQSTTFLQQFTEMALKVAVEYLSKPSYSFQVQVGGLYLVYGLYYTQLSNPKVKVRVTPADWKAIQVFLHEVKSQEHTDVEFVFRKLLADSAFLFVATSEESFPETSDPQYLDREKESNLKETEEIGILPSLFAPDDIDQISKVHEKYHDMKCRLAGIDKPHPNMDVIHTNLVQYITRQGTQHEEYRKAGNRQPHRKSITGTSESDSDFEPAAKKTDAVWSRRALIRAEAFAGTTTVKRSRRHRSVTKCTDEDTSGSPKKSPNKGHKGHQKKSTTDEVDEGQAFNDTNNLNMPKLVSSETDTDEEYIPRPKRKKQSKKLAIKRRKTSSAKKKAN